MKKSFLMMLFATALSPGTCSSNTHTLTVALSNSCNVAQQAAAREVIGKRIATVWQIKQLGGVLDCPVRIV